MSHIPHSPKSEHPLNILNRQMTLIERARSMASFEPRKLTTIIFGGVEQAASWEAAVSAVETKLQKSDTSRLPTEYGELSRVGLYHEGLKSGKAMMEHDIANGRNHFSLLCHDYTFINGSPFGLHTAMFIPTLKLQADAEQISQWLPDAESGKILGAYCQTELGHGTFVRGLETTAVFDYKEDQFIIHSPTPASTKYWPGSLGYSASHAIVMARLIIRGKDYGIHPFMVQLRSLEDFKPMQGVELGDIGLKLGLNTVDNGYAIFDNVRIPRRNMLMRNAQVSREGVYIKSGSASDKHAYATMVYTRNNLIPSIMFQLAQAVTISIRYSTIREQGSLPFSLSNAPEISIMCFRSQNYRLFLGMARSFAILASSKVCDALYKSFIALYNRGDDRLSGSIHSTTAGVKAYTSQIALESAEDARKCCGGHGYSRLSGLPDIVSNLASIATLEGENYVMFLQTARYLVKVTSKIRKNEQVDSQLAYLVDEYKASNKKPGSSCSATGSEFLSGDVQLQIFRHRAARLIFECEERLKGSNHNQEPLPELWNKYMMDLVFAARAHVEYFVLNCFVKLVHETDDTPTRRVLKLLCDFFALSTIESPLSIGGAGFLEDGYVSIGQIRGIRDQIETILNQLLPEAVALTDAWNFSDASLRSAIGRKDGNAYETLLSWTRQLPINTVSKKEGGADTLGFQKYIRPILKMRSKM
ncbi:hypothetical protein BDQ17DRAFT_998503 [Cyathus striatus]|nr:hypothetical protein BDQ17DRAFT_998503 [Cyathus striatus]